MSVVVIEINSPYALEFKHKLERGLDQKMEEIGFSRVGSTFTQDSKARIEYQYEEPISYSGEGIPRSLRLEELKNNFRVQKS